MSWLPGYEPIAHGRNGTSHYAGRDYYNYRPIILLHMTVGMGLSKSYVAGHKAPPHLWINPYTGHKWQTIECEYAALALYQPQFGYHWVNKHTYLLQTEIVGVPVVSQATYTEAQCKWIGEECVAPQAQWLASIGESVDLNQVRYHTNTSGSASEYWHGRMSEDEMADYNGIMGHIDAWGNDHWDCSAERMDWIAYYARQVFQPRPKVYRRITALRSAEIGG